MTQLTGRERAAYVQNMFTQIAKRYDLMNRLMTGGQDIRWRKMVIKLAQLAEPVAHRPVDKLHQAIGHGIGRNDRCGVDGADAEGERQRR